MSSISRKRKKSDFDFTAWVEGASYGLSSGPDGLAIRKALDGSARIIMPDKDSWIDFYKIDRESADEMMRDFNNDAHYAEYGGTNRPPAMMGHKTPRDQAFFYRGSKPTVTYRFGNKTFRGSTKLPSKLTRFWDDMEDNYGDLHFGVMNRYLGNRDSISSHADDEKEIVSGSAIPSLSLGETRTFVVEINKEWKGKITLPNNGRLNINLRHGDVLVMGGNFQHVYRHGVPKSEVENNNTRINVTLRQFNNEDKKRTDRGGSLFDRGSRSNPINID